MDQEKLREYLNKLIKEIPVLIGNGFLLLLEKKHLYQKIEINVESLMVQSSLMFKSSDPYEKMQGELCLNVLKWPWRVAQQTGVRKSLLEGENTDFHIFPLPTIKIFCSTCNRIEPFNPLSPGPSSILNHEVNSNTQQVFILEYECQSCKGLPVVFLVRREEMKIFLEGRSPIEHVDIPKFIPKEQRKFYSDAIVAHNSGQTLAGLFLLRTFIEQHARFILSDSESYADKLLEAYMEKLPDDFKQRFPSLYKIYGDLSDAIHRADASAELFEKTIIDLNKHFEARKLFGI